MTKVALAYSGSLDTAICIHWLRNVKGMKVYTFSANLGQIEYLEPLAERAVELGATAAHIADLRDTFIRDFIYPCVRADARYEQGYFLFSALSRPLIVRELVNIAAEEGCEFIAHGSRGIGNDVIRFENCIRAIAPQISIITPIKEIGLETPQDNLAYAEKNSIKFDSTKDALYNREQNLWGSNIQVKRSGKWEEPPRDTYYMTVPLIDAPTRLTAVEIGFECGVPTTVDGEEMSPVKLIDKINKVAGRNAVGRYNVIENRLTGAKTREIYESPAATVLYVAHTALESAILDKETLHFKEILSHKYADLIYEGKWFTAFRAGLDAFFNKANENIKGTVQLSLYRGSVNITGIKSPNSLYK